ncbi:uncharacterized protein PGTG_20042 [Puccinia graminis f. sp. tritici CRL 75-36-700-3]|uniref:Uncharacterized protein n=1 Tax=Puccinia graminis f. sp. tritici (strain CRL 75-36-700-3 / race SCCL) TaxID=418459 RepID=E3LBY1_PUCGT|nr:uncharacterized protein PGTG_20042 [Puccinia graminis f. sp. tritici CRL 75-36-700-3]EFP94056.2 hypothetical protein PGTG_20042 [Puccinia graminis f. sp. tritici CRL 75-36-700-3]
MEAERPKIRNILKSLARRRRQAADRQSELSLEIDASSYERERVIWSRRRFQKCHLYPAIQPEKKHTPCHPTAQEFQYAQNKTAQFQKFTHGVVLLLGGIELERERCFNGLPLW